METPLENNKTVCLIKVVKEWYLKPGFKMKQGKNVTGCGIFYNRTFSV